MAKTNYLQANDEAFAAQLRTFKTAIAGYATALGVSAAQVTAHGADSDYYNYVLAGQKIMAQAAQQWTAWRDLVRGGGTPPAAGAPVAPTLPTAVTAVAPGIEARFRALVKQIKAHANYNAAIGEALGIEGAEQAGPNLATVQPMITAQISGGRVEVGWGWQGHRAALDQCEIQVDRADGKGFVLLTYDTTPGYVDTQPFPAVPTKWTYKAIYHVGDAQVGVWSNAVSVTVQG